MQGARPAPLGAPSRGTRLSLAGLPAPPVPPAHNGFIHPPPRQLHATARLQYCPSHLSPRLARSCPAPRPGECAGGAAHVAPGPGRGEAGGSVPPQGAALGNTGPGWTSAAARSGLRGQLRTSCTEHACSRARSRAPPPRRGGSSSPRRAHCGPPPLRSRGRRAGSEGHRGGRGLRGGGGPYSVSSDAPAL